MLKVLTVGLLSLVGTLANASGLQAGNYSMALTMTMNGMPAHSMTSEHCFAEDVVKDPAAALARANAHSKDQQCQAVNPSFDSSGGKFQIACTGQMQIKGDVTVKYSSTGFHETMNMHMTGGPHGNMDMQNDVVATRIGACKNPT